MSQSLFVKFKRVFASDGGSKYEEMGGKDGAGVVSTSPQQVEMRAPGANAESEAPTEDNGEEQPDVNADRLSEDTFTVEEAVEAIGFGKFQIILSLLTGLAWMADAMEMMILSILSPALHCDWRLGEFERATITTVVFCGMMSSSFFWGYICDRYGRKVELIFCSVLTFFYGLLSAFSPTLVWMLILRGLVGFGVGGAPQSVTLYAEFLPASARAKCVVAVEIFWVIGTCFEVLLALIVMPTMGWRWLLIFSAFPLLIFSLCCVWLPESARFHVAEGKPDKALKIIERLARTNNKPMPLGRLVASEQPAKRGRVQDLFIPETRFITILLWIIWFVCAFAYYGLVLATTELYEASDGCHGYDVSPPVDVASCYLTCKGLTRKDYTDLLWTTLAEGPGLFVTFVIVDLIGRKKTMALEFVVFSLFTYLLFICTNRAVMTFFIFVARAFVSGAFQAVYVYTPEVYPTTFRALGLGTCSGFARIGAIVTPFVAQVLLRYSVNLTVGIYASSCLIAAVASMLLPIETKGRSMKDTH